MLGRLAFYANCFATAHCLAVQQPGIAFMAWLTAGFVLAVYWDDWK